jgi:LacI family transcriptional regulator
MAEAGLARHYIDAPYWPPEEAAAVGISYLHSHPSTTAVFCANDAVAVALLMAARQAGIDIPGRVSIIGFDDIDLASFVSPGLTTMAVDKVGMGRIAVTLLAHRLEVGKECVTQTLVRPTLVLRESTSVVDSAARPEGSTPELQAQPLPA